MPKPIRRVFTASRYLATGCVAVLLFMAVFACHVFVVELPQLGTGSALGSAAVWTTLAGGIAVAAAIFPGIPLIIATHLILRSEPSESAHIAAFAVIGCLTAVLVLEVVPVEGPIVWTLIVGTTVAAATARWITGRETVTSHTHPHQTAS